MKGIARVLRNWNYPVDLSIVSERKIDLIRGQIMCQEVRGSR